MDKRKQEKQEEILKHPKVCEACDKKFFRRTDESLVKFAKRKTCGSECGHISQVNTWKLMSPNGKLKSAAYKGKLPPVTPLTRQIPPPEARVVEIWRPSNIGRDARPRVS